MQVEFSGLLPPPEILSGYEQTVEGAAERLLAMAERQVAHEQEIQRAAVEINRQILRIESRNSFAGLLFAFLIGMGTIMGACACIYVGRTFAGTFLGTAGLAAIVGTFIYGSRAKVRRSADEKTPSAGE